MKKRGSALVIAMLLMAAIGGIAVLFGRLVFLEIRNTTISTNGVLAYYAAESGIEEAFLRYRYNKDQQIPTDTYAAANGFVSNLDTKAVNSGTANAGVAANATTIFDSTYNSKYWLNIGSTLAGNSDLGSIGLKKSDYLVSPNSDYIIERDNTARVDLGGYFSAPGRALTLQTRYIDDDKIPCAILEVKIIGSKAGVTEERKGLYYSSDSSCAYPDSVLGLNESGNGSYSYVTRTTSSPDGTQQHYMQDEIKFRIAPTVTYDDTIVTIKNIYSGIADASTDHRIAYKMVMDDVGSSRLNNVKNLVTSKGYFGGSTRTLTANINRQYGGLQDLFNYVIYRADAN